MHYSLFSALKVRQVLHMNYAVPIFQNGAFVRDEFELCGIEITKERVARECRLQEKQDAKAQNACLSSPRFCSKHQGTCDDCCYLGLETSKQGMRRIMFVLSHSKCNTSKTIAESVVKV
jgi:hypothetical protein